MFIFLSWIRYQLMIRLEANTARPVFSKELVVDFRNACRHVVEITLPADKCYQFWLRFLPQRVKDASMFKGQFHFPWARSTQLFWNRFHWRLLDYAAKPQRPLLGFFCFTSQATNSKSFLPAANSWVFSYTVTVFCLFVRTLDSAVGRFKLPATALTENSIKCFCC